MSTSTPPGRAMTPAFATALGFAAILLWSTLATLTAFKGGGVPPFQTTAITFTVGGTLLLAFAALRGRWSALVPSPKAFALALYGLFAFHALYFAALKLAPPAEASLIASLWALLTVLLSGLLPGHRLHARHVVAAVLGLAAATLLVRQSGAGTGAAPARILGLGLAFGCALVWASYSVLSRLVAAVPSESLAMPCLATAALAFVCNLLFEGGWTVIPSPTSWLALVLLGLGPVGAAFLLWDIGMKRGHIATLGVLAYAAPIISTVLLVALGLAEATWALGAACVLMVAAAVVAVRGNH